MMRAEFNNDEMENLLKNVVSAKYPQNPIEILNDLHEISPPNAISKEEVVSSVQEFFADANIFITGGTGFLGIVLIEKLLRSCPRICHIYVMVRKKKNSSPSERFNKIFANELFDKLKNQQPNFREKLSPIIGCISEPDLGLNAEDLQLLHNNVNIIFHCAATVRFDEDLNKAVKINTLGTREIIKLANDIRNLKVLMHVSTAYSFCIRCQIEEKIYRLEDDYQDIIDLVENADDYEIKQKELQILQKWPNTYVYTKALSECLIESEGKGLPIGIFRPSVVISTYREPIKGWINNYNGPVAPLLSANLGILRIFPGNLNYNATNLVPVDFVVNAIICTSRQTAMNFERVKDTKTTLPIYNFISEDENSVTWKHLSNKEQFEQWPSTNVTWYYSLQGVENEILYKIFIIFLHIIPAYVIDFFTKISGGKPKFVHTYNKLHNLLSKLKFFIKRKWIFITHNTNHTWNELSLADKEQFCFDTKMINWNKFVNYLNLGFRVYLLHDDINTLQSARVKIRRLYYLHEFLKFVFKVTTIFILFLIINSFFLIFT